MTATKSKFCTECGYNMDLHDPSKRKGAGCPRNVTAPQWPTQSSDEWAQTENIEWEENLSAKANDRQVGVEDHAGGGYGADGVIQHWDFAASQRFDYFQGQITKYVTRWKKKGGLKDLQKAAHFLDKYLEVHERYKD